MNTNKILIIILIFIILSNLYVLNEHFVPSAEATYCSSHPCLLDLPYTYGILVIVGIIGGIIGLILMVIYIGNLSKKDTQQANEKIRDFFKYKNPPVGDNMPYNSSELITTGRENALPTNEAYLRVNPHRAKEIQQLKKKNQTK